MGTAIRLCADTPSNESMTAVVPKFRSIVNSNHLFACHHIIARQVRRSISSNLTCRASAARKNRLAKC